MNLRIPLTGLATLILLASCTAGTEGIFASLEREQKIVSLGGLNKYATVTHMSELGAPVNKYFITGGQAMFSRAVSAVTWDKTPAGGRSDVAAVGTTGGAPGNTVWAISGGTLYRSADGSNWISQPLSGGEAAYDLIPIRKSDGVSNDELFLTTVGSDLYRYGYLVKSSSPSTPLTTRVDLGSASSGLAVTSAINDGASYWLINGATLWQSNGATAAEVAVTFDGNAAHEHGYQGLIYLSGASVHGANGYYLSTQSHGSTGGGLYFGTTAGNFTPVKTDVSSSNLSAGEPVSFQQFLYNDHNQSLWISTGASTLTEGTGYGELMVPSNSFTMTPVTNTNNYNSSAIPTYSVGTLFRASNGIYFLGTVAHGLWYWDIATSTSSPWKQQ